jgi:hypothetical protein
MPFTPQRRPTHTHAHTEKELNTTITTVATTTCAQKLPHAGKERKDPVKCANTQQSPPKIYEIWKRRISSPEQQQHKHTFTQKCSKIVSPLFRRRGETEIIVVRFGLV